MTILGLTGFAMIAASAFGIVRNSPSSVIRKHLVKYLDANGLDGVKIRNIRRKDTSYFVEVVLTYKITLEKFQRHIAGIEQALACSIRFNHRFGATCELELGYAPFHSLIPYQPPSEPCGLKIPLYSPFGMKYLDLADQTSCHILVGGATRMGKSVLLRLIATHIMLATDGQCTIRLADDKITDLYMFRGIPQITLAETAAEACTTAAEILAIAKSRKELLKSKQDVTDIHQLRIKYPHVDLEPIFFIIDEYGRFADNDTFQEMITEIAETAGYVDIHLIIASQRPDAKDVLKPRIKANLVTRICFRTTDEANSKIILDLPDGALLPKIKGRAVLLDGFPDVVQVPFIAADQAADLLQKYRSEYHADTGYENIETVESLPRFVTHTLGEDDLSRSSPTEYDSESNSKKTSKRRSPNRNTSTKR